MAATLWTDHSKLLYNTCQIHQFTQRLPCKVTTALQEQFGLKYLAQGHSNMHRSRDSNQ